jgi:hypothetical protein
MQYSPPQSGILEHPLDERLEFDISMIQLGRYGTFEL